MTLYHHRSGEGDPVVFLHGWAFHSEIWQPLITAMQQKREIHLIDLPGFGRSNELTFSGSLEENLIAMLPYLPEKAAYIGWSLGGLLALQLALSHPERVTRLTLLNSTPCFIEKNDWRGVTNDYFSAFFQGIQENPEKTLRQFILMGLARRDQQKECYKPLWDLMNRYGMPGQASMQNGLWALKNTDLRLQLNQLKCPITVITGDSDPLTPINLDFESVILKGTGHFSLFTFPEKISKLMSDGCDR